GGLGLRRPVGVLVEGAGIWV
ncbi:hypothetical protein CCACVL1_03149, partial [Corchorus capsularis]